MSKKAPTKIAEEPVITYTWNEFLVKTGALYNAQPASNKPVEISHPDARGTHFRFGPELVIVKAGTQSVKLADGTFTQPSKF